MPGHPTSLTKSNAAPTKAKHHSFAIIKRTKLCVLEQVPLRFVKFVLDVSGSMVNHFDVLLKAVKAFIKNLNGDDRIGIVLFSTNVRSVLRYVPKKNFSREKLMEVVKEQSHSSTALYDAVIETIKQLPEDLEALRHYTTGSIHTYVAVLTDGADNASTSSAKDAVDTVRGISLPDVHVITMGVNIGNFSPQLKELCHNGTYIAEDGDPAQAIPRALGGLWKQIFLREETLLQVRGCDPRSSLNASCSKDMRVSLQNHLEHIGIQAKHVHKQPTATHPCLKYGPCMFGDSCTYKSLPGDMCVPFLKGKCKYAANCKYSHEAAATPRG